MPSCYFTMLQFLVARNRRQTLNANRKNRRRYRIRIPLKKKLSCGPTNPSLAWPHAASRVQFGRAPGRMLDEDGNNPRPRNDRPSSRATAARLSSGRSRNVRSRQVRKTPSFLRSPNNSSLPSSTQRRRDPRSAPRRGTTQRLRYPLVRPRRKLPKPSSLGSHRLRTQPPLIWHPNKSGNSTFGTR